MFKWIARKFGYVPIVSRERLSARFDAASHAIETREHWRNADGLSADAAADPATRAILRNRSRYERFNNPFMCGQLRTLGNDTIGVGPILQMQTPNERVNREVERRWTDWAKAVRLASKLRLARITRASDGEILIRLRKNPRLRCPVKLDLQLIEGDQLESPWGLKDRDSRNIVHGIEYDAYDNPVAYYILRRHPGDLGFWNSSPQDYVRVPADDIIHYYLTERAGQHRGIPEIVSSLNTHAERRNYRQSVLTAARAAATLGAAMLESEDGAPDLDEDIAPDPFSAIAIEQGMLTALPPGMKATQMRAEQPSTGYGDLSDRLITEQARPLNMPRNVASGDSSNYNYASGRLDHQTYDRSNVVEQEDELVNGVLTQIITAWAIDAGTVPGYLSAVATRVYLPSLRDPYFPVPCTWLWGEREHVDPSKHANSQSTKLKSKTTTYAREFARDRKDWRNEIQQAGIEHDALDEAGLVQIESKYAQRILDVLRSVEQVGHEAAIDLLTLMGVSRPKAERMVSNIPKSNSTNVPPAMANRMMSAGGTVNGNGVCHV